MTVSKPQITAEDFRAHAHGNLLHRAPDLNDVSPAIAARLDPVTIDPPLEASSPRHAAVLVPVRDVGGHAHVILTQRSHDMPAHAGQISFPGGRLSGPEETPLAAALRESEEEIGLAREQVQILGFLDAYLTGTGYLIAPVVAVVDHEFSPVLEEREVADVFEVPLSFLMDPVNHAIHNREISGRNRRFYAMTYGERFIWGATAAMLKNLYDRIYG